MNSSSFVLFALQIAAMLACAMLCGQIARRLGQPAVLGEMVGGIILGPTVFGALAPTLFNGLFHASAEVTAARDAVIKLGMLFFLFIAGLEVNLSNLKRLGKRAILIGSVGTVLPLAAGVVLAYALPRAFWGPQVDSHFFAFALFLGLNLANSANPVIARILMDLGLLKHDIGTVIMTATVIDDLINWTLFAIILSHVIAPGPGNANMATGIGLLVLFFVVVLGVGGWLGPKALHWARQRLQWPTAFIALSALVILLAAAAAEALGVHAFLGAFLIGAALGGSGEERNEAYEVISVFALSFFAPIYFVSMGLNANFIADFDFAMVAVVVTVACVSKIGGVLLGSRLAGMPLSRESWAIGFGLNARGATGIVLAGVGLEYGLIDERIFVTMVVMALVTSLLSAPAISRLMGKSRANNLTPGEPSS